MERAAKYTNKSFQKNQDMWMHISDYLILLKAEETKYELLIT